MSTGGAINYTEGAQLLRTMAAKVPGAVAVTTRLPGPVAELIETAAFEQGINRSDIIRVALQEWLERQAAEKAATSGTTA